MRRSRVWWSVGRGPTPGDFKIAAEVVKTDSGFGTRAPGNEIKICQSYTFSNWIWKNRSAWTLFEENLKSHCVLWTTLTTLTTLPLDWSLSNKLQRSQRSINIPDNLSTDAGMGGCLSGLVDSQAAAVSTYPGLPQVVEINPKAYTARHACGNVQVNGSMFYLCCKKLWDE